MNLELDKLVAEKVMGWRKSETLGLSGMIPPGKTQVSLTNAYPRYSTDIAAAWEVVAKVVDLGYECQITVRPNGHTDCRFFELTPKTRQIRSHHYPHYGVGSECLWFSKSTKWYGIESTAPHAICVAALKVVEKK